ncbi:MAG: hypothetical protein WAN50_04740 [Minisyncoccia bacterium]
MKGVGGAILFGFGLLGLIGTQQKELGLLWLCIFMAIFAVGLYFWVDDMLDTKLEKLKKEILSEIGH